MRRRAVTVLASVFGVVVCSRAAVALTAREILDRAKALDDTTRHWTDRTQRMTLTIYDAAGERRRELSVYTKRYPGNEEKAISFLAAPAEVRGVAFLQWSHKGREDEQWLYLPEFKRTRQIAARLRDERFVGTDFTFRDLAILTDVLRWTEDEAPSKLLGEEAVNGSACHKIELRPRQEGMPYPRLVLWMDEDKLTPRKLDFDEADGTHVKTLALDDVREVGAIPTPYRLEMQSLKQGSRTIVQLLEVTYNTGLADELFTQRYLSRGGP